MLGMNFISIASQTAFQLCSHGHPSPGTWAWWPMAFPSTRGCFESSAAILRLCQTEHLPRLKLVFQGMIFSTLLGILQSKATSSYLQPRFCC